MLKRTITAVVAVALFIPVCYFSGTPVFPLAMTFLALIACYEMLSCVGALKTSASVPSFAVCAAMPMLAYYTGSISLLSAVAVLYLVCMLACAVFSRGRTDYTVFSSAFTGIFYIALSFACIVFLRRTGGKYLYLLTFIGPWVSDTFAYLCGRAFGKHKLIPEVSPKKTVEGSIGGIVFASVSFIVYALIISKKFDASLNPNYAVLAVSGAIVSVISQIGDLSASVIKRKYGIKDYGRLFPGHGGVMDRFDSVLLTAPVLCIISCIPTFTGMLI